MTFLLYIFVHSNYNYQVKENEWAGHVQHMGEKRNAYRLLVRRPEGKKPLRSHKCRWQDNIIMDLREVAWGVETIGF
jgi:hypothetical protein